MGVSDRVTELCRILRTTSSADSDDRATVVVNELYRCAQGQNTADRIRHSRIRTCLNDPDDLDPVATVRALMKSFAQGIFVRKEPVCQRLVD